MALCLSNCCLIHRNCLSYILSCICMQPVRCLQPCTQPLIIYFYPALSSQPATFYLMLLFFEFLNFDIDTFERHLENKLPKLNLIRFVKCHSQGVESRHCIVGWKPYLVALREYWCANWGTLVDTIHTGHHKTRWLYGSSYVLCGQVFTKIFLHVKFISNVPQRTHSRRWLGQNDIRIQASERNFFIIWSVLHERWRCSFLPGKRWAVLCPVQLDVIMFSAALRHRITTFSPPHSRHIQKLLQPHLSQRTFHEDFTIMEY